MSYYLRGPINSGDTAFLVAPADSTLYFAILAPDSTGTSQQLIFDPRNPENPSVVGLGQTGGLMTLSTGGGFIATNSSSQAILQSSSVSPPGYTPETTQAANFGLVLTGVEYTLTVGTTGTTVQWPAYIPNPDQSTWQNGYPTQIMMDSNTPPQPTLQYLTVIRFVPQSWYALGNCGTGPSGLVAAALEAQWFPTQSAPNRGFTTSDDCATNVFYSYCSVGSTCSSNCKGPCSDPKLTCGYDTSFSCSSGEQSGGLWSQWWVWVLVGIAGLILIILIYKVLTRNR